MLGTRSSGGRFGIVVVADRPASDTPAAKVLAVGASPSAPLSDEQAPSNNSAEAAKMTDPGQRGATWAMSKQGTASIRSPGDSIREDDRAAWSCSATVDAAGMHIGARDVTDPDRDHRHDIETPLIDGWDRARLSESNEWRMSYSDQVVAEVRAHLSQHKNVPGTVQAVEFPAFAEAAQHIRHQLANRFGIVWLRADPSAVRTKLTSGESRSLFSILASLMGMTHREFVAEPAPGQPDPLGPAALETAMIDRLVPDVVGALRLSRNEIDDPTVKSARRNGEIYVVSAHAVHRELESQDSALLRWLYRPVAQTRLSSGPIFRYERSSRSLEFRYGRQRIEAVHHGSGTSIPASMMHAFDVLDKAMNLPHLLTSIRPDRGDVLLMNNKLVATVGLLRASEGGIVQQVRVMRVVNPMTSRAESTVD